MCDQPLSVAKIGPKTLISTLLQQGVTQRTQISAASAALRYAIEKTAQAVQINIGCVMHLTEVRC
jgi:hypothetical protein